MSRQPDLCPGCGAPTHPHAHECAECGAVLPPRRSMLPLIVGAAGVLVALLAGAGVWIMLSPPHGGATQEASAPAQPAPVAPAPADVATAPAPSPSAPAAPEPQAAAPQIATAPSPAPANPPEAETALPTVRPGVTLPSADEPTRRAFAKTTQDNFVQNGLDLQVTTSGQEATTIAIKFNFPAKTAVELIASGPFPRQCKQRGFKTIQFSDPNAISWTYDLATDKLTQK